VNQVAYRRRPSSVQFRGIEIGARLGGIGGFAPARVADQAAEKENSQW